MSNIVKGITISQPYADLIANLEKFAENRSRKWKYRGPVAIHAGAGTQYMKPAQMRLENTVTKAIVAVGYVQGCIEMRRFRKAVSKGLEFPLQSNCSGEPKFEHWLTPKLLLDHKHAVGPYCWIIGGVMKLEQPISINGQQGIWNVPDNIAKFLLKELRKDAQA